MTTTAVETHAPPWVQPFGPTLQQRGPDSHDHSTREPLS